MTDPDDFLIKRVFQPAVDRWGVDPHELMWPVYRAHVIGTISALVLAWGLSFSYLSTISASTTATLEALQHGAYMSPYEPGVFIVLIAFRMWIMQRLLRSSMYASWNLGSTMTRVIDLCQTAVLLGLNATAMTFPKMPLEYKTLFTAFTVSWSLCTVVLYLHACRKPPPRRRDGARTVRFSL